MEKNKGLWILAIYFFLSIYLLPMFPHGGSANELTYWATAASIVENGSFEIGWTQDLIGPNVDAAQVGDKIYSNKPPGTAVLAAPVYALTRLLVGAPNASNIRVSWFAMRFVISTLPLLLLGFWLYARDSDEISLAALLIASPLFIYSLLFFSHVFVAVLLYFAFRLIYDADRIFLRSCFVAGALCGFAVTCEFPAIVPVTVFGGGLLFAGRRNRNLRQTLFFFVAGGLPFAILLLVYNNAVFGSPFALFYAYEAFPEWAEVASQGAYGIGFPKLSNIYLLLLSPSRGLFFFAPLLLLPVVTFFASRERRTLRHRVKVAAVIASVVVISGHGAAHGGWSAGPRYLVLVLPLILDAFFDGEIYEYSNVWQGFLFTISLIFCAMPLMTFPFAPPEFNFPHSDFWGRFLALENWFTPTLANAFGIESGLWSILPAALAITAVLFIVRRTARRPSRFTIGLSLGLLTAGVYIWLPMLDSSEDIFRRATIAERYFLPEARLAPFFASPDPEVRKRARLFEWNIINTRAFAPSDFPYTPERDVLKSPAREIKRAVELSQKGENIAAERILMDGRDSNPQARCEYSTNLALIYFNSGRRDAALEELEFVQPFVNDSALPDCQRSQFLLGSLYRENNDQRAAEVLAKFLANTKNATDAEIIGFRKQLQR